MALSHMTGRMLLVEFLDELIKILEADSEYGYFVLNGQSVVIEDYLKVRDKIMEYVKQGRIVIGPWNIIPDLYVVDGKCPDKES